MERSAVALLIGDVVGSRRSDDRTALHSILTRTLTEVNELLTPLRPLRITVGDEYQGVFSRLGDALAATLLIRVRLAPRTDVRHGVGWGQAVVLDEADQVEDGPGWWAARDAIDAVHDAQDVARTRRLRTAFRSADPAELALQDAVNAALMLRDEMLGELSPRSLSVLSGLMADRTQSEIAAALSISDSAVSQRVRADGLATVLAAHELLSRLGHDATSGGATS